MATIEQLPPLVDPTEERIFTETTRALGTTPVDAIRVFISAFNRSRGFPFDVRVGSSDPETEQMTPSAEPFTSDDDALDFVNGLAFRMFDETR